MNTLPNSELSLYQLTQGLDNSPQTVLISASAVDTLVSALIEILIEQHLHTKVWLKPPINNPWHQQMDRYQQQVNGGVVYLCHHLSSSVKQPPPSSSQIYVELQKSTRIEQESFIIVISPEFSALILTEEEKSLFKMVCTFEIAIIKQVLDGIQQAIAVSDTTPLELLKKETWAMPPTSGVDAKLLTNLLIKQVQRSQSLEFSHNHDKRPTETPIETEKEQFLTRVLRELRPPLTNMKTALRLLESKQAKREQRDRYLQLLQREWEYQNSLISGVLELIQLDNLSEEEAKQPIKLEEIIPGIISTYQPLAQEKGIQLGYTIPLGLPFVACPNHWLRQIILNLLSNSLKYTNSGGKVDVQASVQNDYVLITCRDTGVGIAEYDQPKIFYSFYRGKTPGLILSQSGETNLGVGLGLTIVKQIVDSCQGKINFDTKLDKGTIFRVLLPIAKTP